jgi:hypothetical protein
MNTNSITRAVRLGCDGALRHVVANLADSKNGPVTTRSPTINARSP